MKILSLACCVAAALLVALGSLIWLLKASGAPLDRTPVTIEIAGQMLRIDPAYVRRRSDLQYRQHEEFELVAALPELQPAAHVLAQVSPEFLVVLTLRAPDRQLHPAEKPARLYARFLGQQEDQVSGDLIARRFEAGSPYEGEMLVMTPPEGRLFWARCPLQQRERAPSCLSELRLGDFDLTLRISAQALKDWEQVTQRLHLLISALRQ